MEVNILENSRITVRYSMKINIESKIMAYQKTIYSSLQIYFPIALLVVIFMLGRLRWNRYAYIILTDCNNDKAVNKFQKLSEGIRENPREFFFLSLFLCFFLFSFFLFSFFRRRIFKKLYRN
jgi:hypothetical protein